MWRLVGALAVMLQIGCPSSRAVIHLRDGSTVQGVILASDDEAVRVDETMVEYRDIDWLGRELSPATHVNVMGQYRPDHEVLTRKDRGGTLRYANSSRNSSSASRSADTSPSDLTTASAAS